ncbi:hypothetical protein GDO78_003080 [Eleutherodactylus coqui]|uniref:Uncharacterized protein n=1 Tax=Eleutherodactylus coqui TaxID=57060 RepID=A0A8J6EX54_ELECQ|nr:hypothetical protein GDO78_003080 [Eleutherodactylus coqui]
MCLLMLDQQVLLKKCFPTLITGMDFLPTVKRLVLLQILSLAKYLPTPLTRKMYSPHIGLFLALQVSQHLECRILIVKTLPTFYNQ